MQLRSIQQFIIHFESFRNIDVWYQGAYLLTLQIYSQNPQTKEKVYAHPFAFTQHYGNEEQAQGYDRQIIKKAWIQNQVSGFMTKAFMLKYYEEEVEVNDICHFRVESEISPHQTQYYLQVDLLFYDQQIKKINPGEITLENGKKVRSRRFILKRAKEGLHDYVQCVFDGQYYSLANLTVHSVMLDYRMRMNPIQLFEFSRMNMTERKRLLDKNKKMQNKEINYLKTVCTQLGIPTSALGLEMVQELVVKGMKRGYQRLLREYGVLFGRVITERQRKIHGEIIVHPSQLGLFEDQPFSKGNTSRQQQLQKRYNSSNSEQIIQRMLNEANMISSQLIKLWHHFINLLKMSPRFTIAHYENIYYQQLSSFWMQYRKEEPEKTMDICVSSRENDKRNQVLQRELYEERGKIGLEFKVYSQEWKVNRHTFATIVQNTYGSHNKVNKKQPLQIQDELLPSSSKVDISLHLIVFCHGFQGNSLDMKLIKNNIAVMYPQAAFLCSTSNQDMTDTDIIQMGHRLASQIKSHILQFFPPDTLQRISFVGHSLGGVIIRAALPRLLQLKDKFHTFISFSTPHIGYKVNTSSVVQAGIWFIQKIKNSNCLNQLTMQDHSNPRQTCLYKVSTFEGLAFFKNIYLFSSPQDSYAPYQSARIQIHPDFMNGKDPLKQIHCEMVRNILADVKQSCLRRIRVNFTIGQTSLDTLIGRAAHILFLDNSELIQLFINTHPGLFQ